MQKERTSSIQFKEREVRLRIFTLEIIFSTICRSNNKSTYSTCWCYTNSLYEEAFRLHRYWYKLALLTTTSQTATGLKTNLSWRFSTRWLFRSGLVGHSALAATTFLQWPILPIQITMDQGALGQDATEFWFRQFSCRYLSLGNSLNTTIWFTAI